MYVCRKPTGCVNPVLKSEEDDAIMSSLSITEKRQQEIAFTTNCTLPILVWWWRKIPTFSDSRIAERQTGRRIAGHHPGEFGNEHWAPKGIEIVSYQGQATFILT